jgi:lipopolysaccharide transport system ATP-binding protein
MTAIEFENISKQYRLGLVSTGTLSHDLNRFWQTKILRREDPYLKVGEVNDRASKGNSEYVWALKDINFKVEQGDVLGIIGRNGAGKSTLLKLLSRVTAPTTGTIRARGRIASLLEVGTGFHPEMTGRENIYMNGSIMGMSRAEITRKLDEIVDFSGCERYLDTPVKRYSSGMTVRLGFAIAAHLEPEILVVDEVLAVGDAEFQKKAIGKMQDVSKGEGRTVLFVSHNMGAVKNLCKRGIVLDQGQVAFDGGVEEAICFYTSNSIINKHTAYTVIDRKKEKSGCSLELEYIDIAMLNDVDNMSNEEPIKLRLHFKRNNPHLRKCQFGIAINNANGEEIGVNFSEEVVLPDEGTDFIAHVTFYDHQLAKGEYSLVFSLCQNNKIAKERTYDVVHDVISFEVNFIDENHETPFLSWPKKCSIAYKPNKVSITNF